MIRVEALNHEEKFELIKLFDDDYEKYSPLDLKEFLLQNDNYYLRALKCGSKRKVIYKNF